MESEVMLTSVQKNYQNPQAIFSQYPFYFFVKSLKTSGRHGFHNFSSEDKFIL